MWFSSYLQNQKQFITIDGHNSDIHQVEYGVPQRGILSTLLFLIMINDLNKVLKFTHALLYAGDTTIIVNGQNLRFMSIKINKDLEALSQWLIDNKLTINVNKGKNMIFLHKNMIVDYRNVELIIDNNTIDHVTQFKLQGVWLNNNLTFTTQCIKLRSSINSYRYLLYKMKPLCHSNILQMIYMIHI